jgi:hypothetical protein
MAVTRERTRERTPIQLVTPTVAAQLAGTSLPEVLRWHSAGTGPRAYRVFGCWVFRAREVDAFIRSGGHDQRAGGRIAERTGVTRPGQDLPGLVLEADRPRHPGGRP